MTMGDGARWALDESRARLHELHALLESLRFDQLAALLREVDRPGEGMLQQWAALRDAIHAQLRKVWPRDDESKPIARAVVEHVGVLERVRTGGSTTWEGRRLAFIVAAQVADQAVDRETGEIKPPGVIAHEVATAIVECAGLDAGSKPWRKGALRARGIDPDNYSERSGGRPGVRLE